MHDSQSIIMHRRKARDPRRSDETGGSKPVHRARRRFVLLSVLLSLLLICASVLFVAHTHISPSGKQSPVKNLLEASKAQRQGGLLQKKSPVKTDKASTAKQAHQVTYHTVFSTGCSAQQNWETYVFFYHAFKVKQPGNVTRIVSGCTEKQAVELNKFHTTHIRTMSDRFHLHMTPDYSRLRLSDGKFPYKYMNKPFGLRHWMENVLGFGQAKPPPSGVEDGIIILMDPDMILMRPLGHDFTNEQVIWVKEPARDEMRVRHGNPMSQQDGYLGTEWLELNRKNITGDDASPALHVTVKDAEVNYNAGPPYLVTVRDMYSIVVKWTEFAPRVFDQFPKLFAEMFGYCFASAHLELPHTMVKSIVVSTTGTKNREGWRYVDELPDVQVCNPPTNAALPFVLHYCKRYYLGRFFFSKYRLRKDYLSCGAPLLTVPTNDIFGLDYWIPIPPANGKPLPPDEAKERPVASTVAKRELFMLCSLIQKINEAVEYFKRNHCAKANFNATYNFHDYPYDG